MAKETKKAAEAAVSTVENIYETLDNSSKGSVEISEKVCEDLQKEHDENVQRNMKIRYAHAMYNVERKLLNLRREREIAKLTKVELTHTDRLARYLMGFTVTEDHIKRAAATPDTIFDKGKETADEKKGTITIADKTYKVGDKVPACIDYVDFDKMSDLIPEETRKATREIDKVHGTYLDKLDAKYNKYYDRSWRY